MFLTRLFNKASPVRTWYSLLNCSGAIDWAHIQYHHILHMIHLSIHSSVAPSTSFLTLPETEFCVRHLKDDHKSVNMYSRIVGPNDIVFPGWWQRLGAEARGEHPPDFCHSISNPWSRLHPFPYEVRRDLKPENSSLHHILSSCGQCFSYISIDDGGLLTLVAPRKKPRKSCHRQHRAAEQPHIEGQNC